MKIKICGITNIEDALVCVNEGADALGFIFAGDSPRNISLSIAERIISRLSPFILKIGVFVNERSNQVNSVAEQLGLNAVQLHGDESADYVSGITFPVIKSFRIHNKFNFNIIKSYSDCVILLDSYSEASNGGTGRAFDWNIIPGKIRNDIILAGGISADNIELIHKKIKPGAVDLSSSLELKPGIKDHKKIKEFFTIINKIRNS